MFISSNNKISLSSSSLSSVSSCSSITIILHALNTRYKQEKVHHRKKLFNKKHYASYQNESSSSSSISLLRLMNKKKTKHSTSNKLINVGKFFKFIIKSFIFKNGLNSNRYSASSRSDKVFEEEKTTSFSSKNSLSNSIPDLNNLNLTEPDDENYHQSNSSWFLINRFKTLF